MTDERYGMSLQERVLALENEAAHETEREWNRNMLMGEVTKLARRVDDLERTATETAMKTAATPPAPYRMAEPENIGASVISDGTVFTRTDNSDTPWRQHHAIGLAPLRWDWINNPQPFQSCTLTADDPEPPIGSIVRSGSEWVSEREGGLWRTPWGGTSLLTWAAIAAEPVTLLYRGEA